MLHHAALPMLLVQHPLDGLQLVVAQLHVEVGHLPAALERVPEVLGVGQEFGG